MDKLIKIVLMAFIGVVLPCLSFAVPDFYYYDNFLTGQSPFSVTTDSKINENGYWEQYNPIQNRYGFVTSYSKEQMTGLPSAVPAYDLDLYIGRDMVLNPSEAIVIYSGSSEQSGNSIVCDSGLRFMCLGTTRPTFVLNNVDSLGSNILRNSSGTKTSYPSNWHSGTNFTGTNFLFMDTSSVTISFNVNTLSAYPYSLVYLLVNPTDSPLSFNWNGYGGESISLTGINYQQISWNIVSSDNFTSSSTSTTNYLYILPHIKGNLDIYSFTSANSDDKTLYIYNTCIDIRVYFDFDNESDYNSWCNLVPSSFTIYNAGRSNYFSMPLENIPVADGLAPIFLNHLNATPYIYNKAIYIYDGYININNYDELIAKLKEAGFGSGDNADLQRVIQLMEELNSGGATGAEVKELIGILEQYHNQLIANGDFGSVTNVFDTYKNLLDFSDDMHWLITANNALFGYFVGFIMLCAMFLILNRIMR